MKKTLLILCALLLTAVGASAQTSSWTAPEPMASTLASGNDYYLYNTEAEQFMGKVNLQWGTEAGFSDTGFLATLTYDESNEAYTIYNNGSSSGYVFFNGTYLYLDGANTSADPFTFTAVSDGTYTIQTASAGYLGSDGTETEIKTTLTSESEGIYWELIVEADYELYLAKLDLYDVLVEAEEMGMTDTNAAYKNAGDVYTSNTATVAEIEAAMVALELAMDVDSDYHTGDEVTVNGTRYSIKSENAVVNHSFELGFEGWTNASNYNTITSEKFSLKTDGAQHKDTYLVGTTNSGSNSDGSICTAWAIETGKTYYFSYYVKNLDGTTETEYLKTSLTNSIGEETYTDGNGYPSSVSSDWQHVEYIFEDVSYAYVQVKFRWLENHWGFDNFQLYEVEPSTELLPDDCDYEEGDEIEMSNFKGKVVGTNLFVNGGFNNGVEGWTGGNTYTNALSSNDVTFTETGGYNDGQYLTLKSSVGAANEATPTQAIEVTPGKCYLFVGYTSGTAPSSGNQRYSALFAMEDATTEANHYEDVNEASYSNDLVTLQWGDGEDEYNGWTKTMGVFSVPAENEEYSFSYVGMRMNWSTGSYDGLQLYELDGAFTFPDDADYTLNSEVTIDDVTYTVKSDNLVENGSFNERTNGWTYGSTHAGPLNPYNVNYSTDGGYNDGPYITSKGGHGETNSNVVSQEVDVETGKTYLFVGYTNGTAPSNSNLPYNGLFTMTSETAESGNAIIQMLWGNPDEELNGWTKTEAVFTATTDYVGVRFSWCGSASFDGIQIYEVEAVPETIEWEMTDAGWGTLILPFAVEDEEVLSGLTLYAGSVLSLGETDEDGNTALEVGTASESIEANTPYLVKGSEGTYMFTGVATNTQDSYTVGMLVGTLVDMTLDDFTPGSGQYVLQNHDEEGGEGLAFYPITAESSDVTLAANHCYLSTNTNFLALHLPGMATGIVAVEGAEAETNGAIYDLSGRRVAKAVKGVYIQNGKKVLVK